MSIRQPRQDCACKDVMERKRASRFSGSARQYLKSQQPSTSRLKHAGSSGRSDYSDDCNFGGAAQCVLGTEGVSDIVINPLRPGRGGGLGWSV
jgi:hypothetical protein